MFMMLEIRYFRCNIIQEKSLVNGKVKPTPDSVLLDVLVSILV